MIQGERTDGSSDPLRRAVRGAIDTGFRHQAGAGTVDVINAEAPARHHAADATAGAGSDPARFMLGDWLVDVAMRRLERDGTVVTLEPRPMAVLAELCRRPREVLSAEALLDACWPGGVLGDNPVHKVIAGLRRALQDSATAPRYIETLRKQGYCLVAPIRVLSEQGARSHHGGWRGQSPFRGLEPFGAAHAGVFFGRDGAVADLHQRMGRQWRRGHPLVLLLGPSGSGKTSLVQAGLVPAMLARAGAKAAAPAAREPRLQACAAATVDLAALSDIDPWAALAGALLDWDHHDTPLLSGFSIETLAPALRQDIPEVLRLLRVGLNGLSLAAGSEPPAAPPLLVLDRVEVLFQVVAEADSKEFLACIERLVASRLAVVLAVCRNDFYPSLAAHPLLMSGKEHGAHMDLAPPDAEALAQIIRLPARAAELAYGIDASGMNRLDDRLYSDALQARDALPLLQYTLQELYLHRAPGNELTWAAYDALGGLDGAIGRRAEAVLAGLPAAQQEALQRLLPRLVAVGADDAAPGSRWVPSGELDCRDERALVDAFVEARLFVADHVGGCTGFRVAHEALLRCWPRVSAWVAQHRATLAAREELMPWVRRWLEGGRAGALLLPRGPLLWQAGQALAESPRLFGEDERCFVTRSQARVRRQVRWRWAGLAGALAFAVAAGVAAVRYAELARVAAQREQQSQRLASFMLGDLADQLRPVGKLDLLDRIGEQGLQLLGREDGPAESPLDTLQRAKALVVIGEVNSSRGKGRTELAVGALQRARRLLEPLEQARGLDRAEFYKTLGASAFWLGQIAFDAGDFDAAAREMSRYRVAGERWLAAAPGDVGAKTELAFALNSLGSIAVRRGEWTAADQWFASSLALKLQVLQARPDDADAIDAVAGSRTWSGVVAYVRGEPKRALALYDQAQALHRQLLARYPDKLMRLRELGTLEVRRGEALHALGRQADSMQAMAAAVDWLRQAEAHDTSNRRWRVERLHAETGQLLAMLDAGMPAKAALTELRHELAQAADAQRANDYLWREALARAAVAEVQLAALQDGWPRVLAVLPDAQAGVAELLRQRPRNWQARELQARLGLFAMTAHAALGPPASLAAACAGTRELLQSTVDAGQAGLVLEAWLTARDCAGGGPADTDARRRLSDGGYQPVAASLRSLVPSRRTLP